MLDSFFTAEGLMSLLTLTALEIVFNTIHQIAITCQDEFYISGNRQA